MLADILKMFELATSSNYFITNVAPYWVAFVIAIVAARRWLRW